MTDGDDMPWRRYKRIDPRRPLTHLAALIGRRGAALAIVGTLWTCVGALTLATPPTTGTQDSLAVPIGVAWIVTGVIAIMSAGHRQGRDAVGFLALYVMAAWRVATNITDAVLWATTDGGDLRGLVGAIAWLAVIALIVVISGWREPSRDEQGWP